MTDGTHLDTQQLAACAPSLDDERSTTVTITPAGRALFDRVLPGHVEVVRQMLFAPLDLQDVAGLTSTLVRVRDRIRAQPPRSAAPRAQRKPAAPIRRSLRVCSLFQRYARSSNLGALRSSTRTGVGTHYAQATR